MNKSSIVTLFLFTYLILEQDHNIDDGRMTEEKRTLASAMTDMLFLDNEILTTFAIIDAGYKASDVIKVLGIYDLTEPEQQIYALNEIKNHSKLQDILTRVNAGISDDIF